MLSLIKLRSIFPLNDAIADQLDRRRIFIFPDLRPLITG